MIRIPRLILVFAMLIPLACEELDENPDFITQENFFSTAEQLELGINAIYDGIGYGQNWENHFYDRYVFECLVGYQVGWEKGPLDFQNGNVNPGDFYIRSYWEISYRNINRANAIIEKADELKEEGVSNTALLDRVKAEAMFLRAFYYYNLVRYFDDVPFTTQRTESDQDLPSNENGKRNALDLIEGDLNAITDVLPEAYTGTDVGRATKWASLALLVKAYLLDEKWNEARTTAETIMNEGGFALFEDFAHNFDVEHENSGERIFEAQVSAAANAEEYNNHHSHFVPADLPNSLGGVGWHWLNGTKAFRMKYDPDDRRIPGTFITEYPSNRVGVNAAGEFPIVRWSEDAPYNLSRFGGMVAADADPDNPETLIFSNGWVSKLVEVGIANANLTERNIVYLRFADVLLGHSEAANESGTGDPYFGINEVRRRAGLDPLSGLSQSELRDAIVEERVLEFAFEQETYPELKRKSTFGGEQDYLGDYIQEFIDTYDVDRTLSPRDYVLPLPLNEVLGNPNVQQHSVY
ncbi:RagB/SusD family nutrient uptake outer membrane protein [Catalinimonas niigatensis]|uniref:RagB/SusD family nutrient uptake outer membrane protein n=1 Tax=Catalinimonas niigatensis TaxID=1397264 RepID=UPI00266557FB|nr:RagB/SusD family nutrient uptake outer membrane protein [Catalinimonas niigatensis]WPP49211.1 RagB/SusD family nutrient uptake outer membrane protein [Catalinimonas niigatensis]